MILPRDNGTIFTESILSAVYCLILRQDLLSPHDDIFDVATKALNLLFQVIVRILAAADLLLKQHFFLVSPVRERSVSIERPTQLHFVVRAIYGVIVELADFLIVRIDRLVQLGHDLRTCVQLTIRTLLGKVQLLKLVKERGPLRRQIGRGALSIKLVILVEEQFFLLRLKVCQHILLVFLHLNHIVLNLLGAPLFFLDDLHK